MANDFLIRNGIKKQKFDSFEIEKNISDHFVIVTFSAIAYFMTIRINESERLLHIIAQPYIGDFSPQNAGETEEMSFLLPDCVEIQGYFIKNENQKTYVIFRNFNSKQGFAYYY